MSNLELYEALKEPVGEEAARMIAEVVPAAGDLATKGDVGAVQTQIEELQTDMARMEARIMGRLWVMFIPLWVGLYGLIGTLVAALILNG